MKKVTLFIFTLIISANSFSSSVEDISTCVATIKQITGLKLDENYAVRNTFLFKPNEVSWPNALCTVDISQKVKNLVVDTETLIVDGIFGLDSKYFLDKAKLDISLAKEELRRRERELTQLDHTITTYLSSYPSNLENAISLFNETIESIFNQNSSDLIESLHKEQAQREAEKLAREESKRLERQAEQHRNEIIVADCVNRGISYFKSIGSYPLLHTDPNKGRSAEEVVRERCNRTTTAF